MPSQSLSGALTTQSKRDPAGCTENDDRKTHGSHRATVLAQHASSLVAIRTVGLRHRHRCRRYCSRPRRPCESHRPGLAADVVFLEVIGGYFTGYCVGIVVAIIQGVCPRRFRHGTPATTCSRGMACTGDSHHGDPAMERGTTMRGRSMCIQSCCRCSLTCISTGRHEAIRPPLPVHPWGGENPMGGNLPMGGR